MNIELASYYEKPPDDNIFYHVKYIRTMENSTHQQEHHHISDGVRNTLIFLFIFGIIALITYLEWAGKLH